MEFPYLGGFTNFEQVKEVCAFVGFYKTDLIHAFHAYSNPAERDRRMGIVEQRVFDLFSRSNYGFLEEGPACLYKYLHSLRYLEELQKFVDDENIKRSKYVEPDSMESSSATEDKSGGGVSCSSKRNTGDVPTLVEVAVMEDGHDGIRATNLIDDSAIEVGKGAPSRLASAYVSRTLAIPRNEPCAGF